MTVDKLKGGRSITLSSVARFYRGTKRPLQ
jgi:hypothetical protein